jgi:hypothetical protein
MFGVSPDIVLGVVTVLMALLGAAVSLHPPESLHDPHKWWVKISYAAAFAVLGTISIVCVLRQSEETVIANQNLTNALGKLQDSTGDIARMTGLNAQLQQKLLKQNDTIAELSKENISAVTGGDTFCYVDISPLLNPDQIWLEVFKVGKYPMRSVTMRIMDRNREEQAMQKAMQNLYKDHTPTNEEILNAMTQHPDIREFIPDFAKPNTSVGGYQLVGGDQQGFDILFRAFNGDWIERLELRRVNGKWARALLVETGQKSKPYFVKVDRDYPRKANGHIDVLWPVPANGGTPLWERGEAKPLAAAR